MTITLLLTDRRSPGCVIVERSRATVHVRVHARARQLDRAIARGVSPDSSADLSVRAHDLIGSRARGALAKRIRTLVDDAATPLLPLHSAVPICRSKVRLSRRTLEEIAARLLCDEPLEARGLAQLRLLLSDGGGPVYNRPGADDLEPALERALAALELRATR